MTTLYSGTSQITSTTSNIEYDLSDSIINYDFLLINIGSYNNTAGYYLETITAMPVSGNAYQFWANSSGDVNWAFQFSGWTRFNTNTKILVALRKLGSSLSYIYLDSVIGIRV